MTSASSRKRRPKANKQLKIGKSQIINAVRKQSGINKDEATHIVNAVLDEIKQALVQGHSVGLAGIGTLTVKETKARSGNLPGSEETFSTPAGHKVAFKISTKLKQEL